MLLKDYKRQSGHWEQVKLTTTGHVEYTAMILSHQHHKILAFSLKLKKGLPLMQLVRPTVPPCHFRERLGIRHAHVALNVSTSLVVVLNKSLPSLPYQGLPLTLMSYFCKMHE
jgi:hypothetical protein